MRKLYVAYYASGGAVHDHCEYSVIKRLPPKSLRDVTALADEIRAEQGAAIVVVLSWHVLEG